MVTHLSWITAAPISYVKPDDVPARVKRFNTNLGDWGEMGSHGRDLSAPETPGGLEVRINGHTGGAAFIAGLMIADEKHKSHTCPVFEYTVDGQPIALMQLELRDVNALEIKNIATHPGAQGAGTIMVEFALNKVTSYIKQKIPYPPGVIYLESYNEDSTAAYLAMGFKSTGKRDMVLDANASDKWKKVGDGQWVYASAEGMLFASRV